METTWRTLTVLLIVLLGVVTASAQTGDGPVLEDIGDILVNETETVTIVLNATEPDNDTLTYSTNASCGILDGNVFAWTTGYDDAGLYYWWFDVSDGNTSSSTSVNLTVNDVNRQPTFVGEIGDILVNETETVTIVLNATEPDNDTLTYSTDASYGSLDDNVFTWTTGYDDAGLYYWWFDVSDGSLSSSTSVKITVNDVNRCPEFDWIEDVSADENETVTITLGATDPDNDTLTYSTDASYGSLDDNVFTWTTGYDDAGAYHLNFGVSDGKLSDDVTVTITVNGVNRQPTLVCEPAYMSVYETETVTITLAATDPDNDTLTYSTDASYGSLDDNVFTWTTGYDDEGVHYLNFGVSDGELSDTLTVEVTVNRMNRPPEFEPIGNRTVWEGQKLQFKVNATDAPDNDPLTYSCVDLPNGAEFDSENQQFTWTPTYTQSRVYSIIFVVTDGIDTASETIAITVTDVRADAGEDQMVHTDDLVTLDASGTTGVHFGAEFIWTEDGRRLSSSISFSKYFRHEIHNITLTVRYGDGYTATDMVNITVCSTSPVADAGADQQVLSAPVMFDGRGSYDSYGGIESYEWTWVEKGVVIGTSPVVTYSFPPGIHTVSLKVTDNDDTCHLTDTDTVTVEVISSPPVASAGNDLIVKHGEGIAISGYRSTDNTKIISYTWIDNSGTILSGDMNYTTNLLPVGRNEVTLEVEDEIGEVGTDKVVITVLSDSPVANAGNDAAISLGQTTVLDGSNSYDGVGSIMSWRWVDMDGNTLSYSERYTFDSMDFGIGNHGITLIVTDDTGEIGRDEMIVTARSDPPIADAGPDVLKRVGEAVTLSAIGSYDTNGTIIGYEWISSEGGYVLSRDVSFDNWYSEGNHTIVVTVTDDAGETDIDTVVVTLLCRDCLIENQPPTSHAGKDKTVDRNELAYFDGSGSKDDNRIVSYSWDFGDGESGSGERSQHIYTDEGSYTVTLTVTDSDGLTSSDTLDVTVIGKRHSTLSIAASPTEVEMYTDLTVSGSISPQPENPAVVTLTFTSPTGRTIVETVSSDSSGSYSLEFRPIEDGVWSVWSEWDGDDNLFGDVSNTITFTVKPLYYVGCGIIIVGSGEGGGSQQYIDLTANRAYQVLLQRGFTHESIFYLNPADRDYKVDRVSSLSNISYAITEWTQGKVNSETPLFVYLVDHGGNDEFYVKGYSEKLTSAKLDEHLDRVTSTDIVVVYDACNSGSFINELSGDGRIVITSTGESANAGIDTTGALFSTYFFNSISDARTIKEAFEDASNSPDIIAYSMMLMAAEMSPQTPLLDDNSDCAGHAIEPQLTGDGELLISTGDGELAASTYIGPQVGALNLPPAITGTGAVQSQIETDKSVRIWATVDDDGVGAFNGSVYATIIAPSYRVCDAEDTLFEMNLPTLNLEDPDADGNYAASFTPTESGDYTMIIHATDQEGNIASPVLLTLDVSGDIKGDVNGDGELTSADAVLVLQMAASGQYDLVADVNHDGSVTSLDALMIQQACAGKIVLSG